MRLSLLLAASLFPATVFAAGSNDSTPPSKPKCVEGKVYDTETKGCVDAQSHLLDDGERYSAMREYAYARSFDEAYHVLDAMQDQSADGVLTYRGYLARSTGDYPAATKWYDAALESNPDNLLARSYLGQFYVLQDKEELANEQLIQIRARGGAGEWPETALAQAINAGYISSY